MVIAFVFAALMLFVPASPVSAAESVILKESANGSRNLHPFTVQDHWEVRWDATDRLSIWINDADGNPVGEAASQNKAGSGRSYQVRGGTYFLKVIGSHTDWTITVVQLP